MNKEYWVLGLRKQVLGNVTKGAIALIGNDDRSLVNDLFSSIIQYIISYLTAC